MLRPAFLAVDLRYGCHHGRWEIPDPGRPVIIAGPNGAGKTTLVEGLLRTLFGFERRRGSEAERLEVRRPWRGRGMRGAVTLGLPGERYELRRDFGTDRVRLLSLEEGIEEFEGDGNPGARNQEARRYRRILEDLVGLADLDAYGCTLFVRQGGLPQTSLGDHLLRVAAGGHARVDGARREIAEAHRAVTRRPIHAAARAAVNPRELERLDDEIAAVSSRLHAARQAGERRGPLTIERERVADRLARLESDLSDLEEAQSALARSGAVEIEARQLRLSVRKMEGLGTRLERDAAELQAAEAQLDETTADGVIPDSFPELLARAELRWSDAERYRRAPPLWPLLIVLSLLAAAAGLVYTGAGPWAAVAGFAGALFAGVWVGFALHSRRRLEALEQEIRGVLAVVPGGDQLSPESRDRFLSRFHAQQFARRRVRDARWQLAGSLRDTRALLRESLNGAGTRGTRDGPAGAGSADGRVPTAEGRASALRMIARLHGAAERTSERLIRGNVELERVGELSLRLPDGVPPTAEEVARGLARRRAERAQVQQELQRIGQDLLERGTPAESVDALEAELAALVPRREALNRKAAVFEAAHALVADAYDAFRDRDQERLVKFISRHLDALSGGQMGPVVVPELLDDARVKAEGRLLPLTSPPLSFGEWHALLLAIRLGAADFLAGIGVLPPLVIDEPFAHLDTDRALHVWRLLNLVARERQVIITTQDRLLLDALEAEPDIRLGPRTDG